MKRLVNQIFLIPLLFLIFGIIAFVIFYSFFINDVTKKEFKRAEIEVINTQKKILKKELESAVAGVESIRSISFDITEDVLDKILEMFIFNYQHCGENKLKFFLNHQKKDIFFYIVSNKLIYPKITQTFMNVGNKKRLIVLYNNKKYLAVEKEFKDKKIGVAFSLDELDLIIKHEIIEFIKSLNRYDSISYIAIGKVTNWFANKGIFGEIIYHPISFLNKKPLNLDTPDASGKFYKKEYFECLKTKDGCFEKYVFKNPKTGKIESKISYFKVYRPYNFVFVKGLYVSQISKDIKDVTNEIVKDTKELFFATLILLFIFSFISFLIAYFISKRIIKKVLISYEKLENSYNRSKKLLYKKIYYDKVTSLPNQAKLREDIDKFESLVILDIDDFASINNLYGFHVGDEVLKCVAGFLKERFRDVYKVGSDEFAIPLKMKIKEKVLRKISKWDIECNDIMLSFKIGASNVEDLFITAENALKIAQKKNLKYLLYDEKLALMQKQRFEELKKLKYILKNEDIVPFYQCIVDKNGNILKYEALMRLKYKKEFLSPFLFMDIIKEAKLYHEFSRIIIKKVFEDIKRYDVNASINLSFIDIVEDDTKELILNLLKEYKIGNKITFEILESESIENFEKVVEFINEIKAHKAQVAIDDFGSGYSNLVNILSLKPDFIKIDGSLVKNINDKKYFEIIKLITEFSKKFNIKIIAEFVETEEIFEKLQELGVDYYQGYYFCKPNPLKNDKIS